MSADSTQRRRSGRPKDAGLPARRRAQIVQHAINAFATHGYSGADLDAIARNADCSKGTLYKYFASKGELFSASVDQVILQMMESLRIDESADAIEQLQQGVEGFLAYFAKHPQHVELLVLERSDFRDRKTPTFYRYRTVARGQFKQRFIRLVAEGRMRAYSADQAIDQLGNLLYGAIFLNHFRGRKNRPARQAREMLEILFGGLLTETEYAARFRKQQASPKATARLPALRNGDSR